MLSTLPTQSHTLTTPGGTDASKTAASDHQTASTWAGTAGRSDNSVTSELRACPPVQ